MTNLEKSNFKALLAFNSMVLPEEKRRFYLILFVLGVLFCIAVIEIKHIYMIDLYPQYDFKIDNAYFLIKEKLGL
ncbi:MAG: hypothetical protein ACOVP1_05710 [Bacteroidia bacterium]